jgi:hypothetical protein
MSDTDMLRSTPSGKSEKSSSSWQSHGINLQMIDQANSFLNAAADDSKKSFIANQLTPSTHCTVLILSVHAEAETVSLIRATLEALHKEVTCCVYATIRYHVQYVWVFPFPQNETRLHPPPPTHTHPTHTIQDQILEQKDACVLEQLASEEV